MLISLNFEVRFKLVFSNSISIIFYTTYYFAESNEVSGYKYADLVSFCCGWDNLGAFVFRKNKDDENLPIETLWIN